MASQKPKRILLVEDQEDLRHLWQSQLEMAGYEVLLAGNGDIGKFVLQLESVDLVISDIKMPKMSGIELAKHIKSKKPVPIILVTADFELSKTSEVSETGADVILTKPFTRDELLEQIEGFLAA